MADVLTQSQIDALLSAAQSGTLDEEKEEEQKVRKYDFNTPKKYTKDRLRMIGSVYENYARLVASHLTSMMRIDIEVELLAVEEQRYYEFNNALSEEDIMAFIEPVFPNTNEINDPLFFQLSLQVIHGFVDRMLGGTGDDDPTADANTITEVEMVLYEQLVSKIAPVMNSVWDVYVEAEFEYSRMETNPRLIQAIGMDEIVVIVALSVRINEVTGQMNICLPNSFLDYVFKKIDESAYMMSRKKETQTQEDKDSLFRQIKSSELYIVAHMGRSSYILLDDLFRMKPGDIINLAIPKTADIKVDVGGNEWFEGKMGTFKGNKAVQINKVLDHDESEIYEEERA